MSLSPAINGEPTRIIKVLFAAFVLVLCDRGMLISQWLTPHQLSVVHRRAVRVPMDLEEGALLQEGSLFHARKKRLLY
jgi:hypothetical protein